MEHVHSLGQSDLKVPRLGVGAMTWGEARGLGTGNLMGDTLGASFSRNGSSG